MPDGLYDADFFLWTQEQARLLRECARAETNLPLDWQNLAEEIESVGGSQKRELDTRLTVLVEHLLKLQFSRATGPRRLWTLTVRTQRHRILRLLEMNPSLKSLVPLMAHESLAWIAEEVAIMLGDEGELVEGAYGAIVSASYTTDQLLTDWLPDPPA